MTHQVSQTSKRTEADPKTRFPILTYCPVTGEKTKKLTQNHIIMPYGQASWWHCLACGGWHLALEQEHNRPPPGTDR